MSFISRCSFQFNYLFRCRVSLQDKISRFAIARAGRVCACPDQPPDDIFIRTSSKNGTMKKSNRYTKGLGEVAIRVKKLDSLQRFYKEIVTQIPAQYVPILTWVNPSLIRARVYITDILRPTAGALGPGDPSRVRVSVTFNGFLGFGGEIMPVRFDPADSIVYCTGDSPTPVTLNYRYGRYVGDMPRGRTFPERLPNYYYVHVRVADREYNVARVPVVEPVSIVAPRPGALQFADEDVTASFACRSFDVLWANTDYHFQFQHENTALITERRKAGSTRFVSQRTEIGGHRDSPETLVVSPELPYATSGNSGTLRVAARYRLTDYTAGPSDFLLDEWVSTAGAEVDFVWSL